MTPVPLPINLVALLERRTIESERVEYKTGWNPESALHTICAFANDFHNLGGGYLVIGVEEQNGRPISPPVGVNPDSVDAIQKELLNLGRQSIQPSVHPLTALYMVGGKTVLVIWVPGGEVRPYKTKVSLAKHAHDWAYYVRLNAHTVRAKGEIEQELLSLTNKVPFDDRINHEASLDDLSRRFIGEFLDEIGSELRHEAHTLSVEVLGRQMNIIGGPSESLFPKNVGLLFFNEAPHRFFPATQIDVVFFPDGPGGDRLDEKEFRGPLARITRDAIDYIVNRYLKETVLKHADRSEAERFWNYPRAAIEEAIVNAVYHRDYQIREPVEVRITREDLVVLSFPGPDRSIPMKDLQAGKAVSRRYRNRRIGEFLKELDLTEGRSTGVPKILRAMQTNGSPPPQFETDEDRSYFLVRLPIHERADWGADDLTVRPAVVTVTTNAPILQAGDQVGDQVSDQVRELVSHLDTELHRDELQARVAIKSRRYFRVHYLAPAIAAGLVEMTDPASPNSPRQRYRLTLLGRQLRDTL